MANMTEREFLTNIINGTLTDAVKEYATNGIAKLDAKNDKRKNTKSKEQIANDGIKEQIVAYLGNGSAVASSVATALSITTSKASALLRQLVENGRVTAKDIKVKNKGSVKEYTLVPTENAEDTAEGDTEATE